MNAKVILADIGIAFCIAFFLYAGALIIARLKDPVAFKKLLLKKNIFGTLSIILWANIAYSESLTSRILLVVIGVIFFVAFIHYDSEERNRMEKEKILKQVCRMIKSAISANRNIRIEHKELGQISIHPIKIDGDFVIADLLTVDRLADKPYKSACLALKDITTHFF